tara:strand:- start:745 stop:1407 length:663 start_codon:yes stop_codon:yes gene_type:complete
MTFHGREWLPISEAAKYLSEKSEETWREQHVYIAVLEGRLPLVARLFSGTKDLVGKEVEGLVNVPIKGGAKQYLEHLEQAVHDPFPNLDYVKIDWIAGAVVERDGEEHCLGLVPGAHSVFPTGTQLGVRVEALEASVQQMPPKSADALDKPLGEKERTTLLVIIGALAEKAKIDVSHPTTAAKTIMRSVELLGAKLSRQAIERKLKLVPDAVEKQKTLKQ